MQRSAAAPTQAASAPFLSTLFGGGGSNTNKAQNPAPVSPTTTSPTTSKSQRPPSSGEDIDGGSPRQQQKLVKDRKPSFGRHPSFIFSSSPKRSRRRADSAASATNTASPTTADGAGPLHQPLPSARLSTTQLPDPSSYPLDKMLSRGAVTPITGYPVGMAGTGSMLGTSNLGAGSELGTIHQHIQETANKRISTLEYLRKA